MNERIGRGAGLAAGRRQPPQKARRRCCAGRRTSPPRGNRGNRGSWRPGSYLCEAEGARQQHWVCLYPHHVEAPAAAGQAGRKEGRRACVGAGQHESNTGLPAVACAPTASIERTAHGGAPPGGLIASTPASQAPACKGLSLSPNPLLCLPSPAPLSCPALLRSPPARQLHPAAPLCADGNVHTDGVGAPPVGELGLDLLPQLVGVGVAARKDRGDVQGIDTGQAGKKGWGWGSVRQGGRAPVCTVPWGAWCCMD